MPSYVFLNEPAKPATFAQRDKLRELRKWLSIYCWRRLTNGNPRREPAKRLIAECDRLLRREVQR